LWAGLLQILSQPKTLKEDTQLQRLESTESAFLGIANSVTVRADAIPEDEGQVAHVAAGLRVLGQGEIKSGCGNSIIASNLITRGTIPGGTKSKHSGEGVSNG
jgi:hypothetical protein